MAKRPVRFEKRATRTDAGASVIVQTIGMAQDPPDFWTREQSAAIAALGQKLLEAAEAGDDRACNFLGTFGPWATEQLQHRLKS